MICSKALYQFYNVYIYIYLFISVYLYNLCINSLIFKDRLFAIVKCSEISLENCVYLNPESDPKESKLNRKPTWIRNI